MAAGERPVLREQTEQDEEMDEPVGDMCGRVRAGPIWIGGTGFGRSGAAGWHSGGRFTTGGAVVNVYNVYTLDICSGAPSTGRAVGCGRPAARAVRDGKNRCDPGRTCNEVAGGGNRAFQRARALTGSAGFQAENSPCPGPLAEYPFIADAYTALCMIRTLSYIDDQSRITFRLPEGSLPDGRDAALAFEAARGGA